MVYTCTTGDTTIMTHSMSRISYGIILHALMANSVIIEIVHYKNQADFLLYPTFAFTLFFVEFFLCFFIFSTKIHYKGLVFIAAACYLTYEFR